MNALSDFEIDHPKLAKPCNDWEEKERDGGWKGLKDMPIPKGAIIKKQSTGNLLKILPLQKNPSCLMQKGLYFYS